MACYTSDIVSVVVAETDPNPSKVTDLDDFATDLDEVPSPDPRTYYPVKLAAVSNPDFNSSGFECESQLNANLHNLQIQLLERIFGQGYGIHTSGIVCLCEYSSLYQSTSRVY